MRLILQQINIQNTNYIEIRINIKKISLIQSCETYFQVYAC